jgi:N-acetylglucosamine kinase-like BadF-type ATPase
MRIKSNNKKKNYLVGVDGGGTRTIAALANLEGKILKTGKSGSSSPRNIGIEKAVDNVAKAINQVLKGKKGREIISVYIGLPAVAEEFKSKRGKIKKELFKIIPEIFQGKVEINSDQKVAFRAGTDQRNGVLMIAGTGCVVHGWKNNKEAHSSGWGWLADEGSAFFIGQKVFQAILKDLDERGPKTLLTKLTFKEFKIKKREELADLVYSKNPTEIVPRLSIICDKASEKKDRVARNIMVSAGKELVLTAKSVIRKLNFKKLKFPLVLAGGMFKSKTVLKEVKKGIKETAPEVKFVLLRQKPVIGAVKLAVENI